MSDFLRPEARATLWRWREVIVAAAFVALGLRWALASYGVLSWLGWVVAAISAALGMVALQRLRFGQGGGGPGIVQIDERQLSYFGPLTGGVIDLDDLARLELVGDARPAHWRLTPVLGEALDIPVTAEGADGLFDVFATLPGLRTERMLETLSRRPDATVVIWQAEAAPVPRIH